jgi:FtsH-binding integral membrane protein
MSDFNRNNARTVPADRADMSVDAGLRRFMLGVYNKMGLGLLVAAGMAYLTSAYPPVMQLLYVPVETQTGPGIGVTPLGWVVQFAPIVILLGSMFMMRNPSARSSGILYWTIVALIGAGLGAWLLLYTLSSVALSFLITATMFGALSLVGYTTKKDLSGWGGGLIMATWGLLATSLIGFIWAPPGFSFLISIVGVVLMAGIIVWKTQDLKLTYYELGGSEVGMAVATNYGALMLFIAFTNLFKFLLMLLGGRRE